jgi:hypothetical protein
MWSTFLRRYHHRVGLLTSGQPLRHTLEIQCLKRSNVRPRLQPYPVESIRVERCFKAPNGLGVSLLRYNQVVPATDTPAAAGITHGQ